MVSSKIDFQKQENKNICLKGHNLTFGSFAQINKFSKAEQLQCDKCKLNFSNLKCGTFRCKTCDYDICEKCYFFDQNEEQLCCKNGHKMSPIRIRREKTYTKQFECDCCKLPVLECQPPNLQKQICVFFRCMECDQDMCQQCSESKIHLEFTFKNSIINNLPNNQAIQNQNGTQNLFEIKTNQQQQQPQQSQQVQQQQQQQQQSSIFMNQQNSQLQPLFPSSNSVQQKTSLFPQSQNQQISQQQTTSLFNKQPNQQQSNFLFPQQNTKQQQPLFATQNKQQQQVSIFNPPQQQSNQQQNQGKGLFSNLQQNQQNPPSIFPQQNDSLFPQKNSSLFPQQNQQNPPLLSQQNQQNPNLNFSFNPANQQKQQSLFGNPIRGN